MDESAAKEYLLEHDARFRELAEQHQSFERELTELAGKPFLSTEEQLHETEIKKRKLILKDQMQSIIDRHQSQHALS